MWEKFKSNVVLVLRICGTRYLASVLRESLVRLTPCSDIFAHRFQAYGFVEQVTLLGVVIIVKKQGHCLLLLVALFYMCHLNVAAGSELRQCCVFLETSSQAS